MKETDIKQASKEKLEQEGMEVYQYIVDNCETCSEEMPKLIDKMRQVDLSANFSRAQPVISQPLTANASSRGSAN